MAETASESSRILAEARASLQRQQAGGRRVGGKSIGRRSAELKRLHMLRKAARMAFAVMAILLGALVTGLVIDGIGFTGIVVTFLAMVAALAVLGTYPRMKVPELGMLNRGDVRSMVARTELWLEAQRPALPAPAVGLIDQIGVQLDGLGLQLEGVDPAEPAVTEVRKLVGEHLPGMVESYRRIPANLRRETRDGRSADQQLTDGLGKISQEIDAVTRQLAAGDLDALAVRGRFLDYKYGDGLEQAAPQLAAPNKTES
ncbi:hypothetical protein [Novosphingobium sp.]|uniref:hypothetical protein n=1 Tax=Novosphingobium sp. TaxID=1874826 RepID=UPI00262CA723|nr:hypothetical protein [Novosphingobium sp.]